jgi:hypothetical protein
LFYVGAYHTILQGVAEDVFCFCYREFRVHVRDIQ